MGICLALINLLWFILSQAKPKYTIINSHRSDSTFREQCIAFYTYNTHAIIQSIKQQQQQQQNPENKFSYK